MFANNQQIELGKRSFQWIAQRNWTEFYSRPPGVLCAILGSNLKMVWNSAWDCKRWSGFVEFTEKAESGERMAMFYCKVLYAVDFEKLRKLIFPAGETQFIRSLSRCYKWNAKGGKSGLHFCKTKGKSLIETSTGYTLSQNNFITLLSVNWIY